MQLLRRDGKGGFDPSHADRLKKASFLATLSSQITQPVMPDDEPFEYLVTQAIADYLTSLSEPMLDGIIYPSVQDGKNKKNVVLFHKSAKVALLDIPRGTDISAHVTSNDEDGPYPDYWVFEAVPAPEDKDDPEFNMPSMQFLDGERHLESDGRKPALSIDIKSLQVHHISRAAYTSEMFPVTRHRTQMSKRAAK